MEPRLAKNIICHSFSFDNKLLAFSDLSRKVYLYYTPSASLKTWQHVTTIKEHESTVSSIAFHPSKYRFVSCSHDRNAYVWDLVTESSETASLLNKLSSVPFSKAQKQTTTAVLSKEELSLLSRWTPKLVITKLQRAALHIAWNPQGDRFAIASGAKVVSVCSFDPANDWWGSSLLRKHRSSITKVAWHPNGIVLATASVDYRVRLMSANCRLFKPEADGSSDLQNLAVSAGPSASGAKSFPTGRKEREESAVRQFGEKALQMGELLLAVDMQSKQWVETLAFTPEGDFLLFSSHDRKMHSVSLSPELFALPEGQREKELERYLTEFGVCIERGLKLFRDIRFVNSKTLVCGGHDGSPVLFEFSKEGDKGVLKFLKSMKPAQSISIGKETPFEQKKAELEAKLSYSMTKAQYDQLRSCEARHSNAIEEIGGNGEGWFSTCGRDGRVLIWDL